MNSDCGHYIRVDVADLYHSGSEAIKVVALTSIISEGLYARLFE